MGKAAVIIGTGKIGRIHARAVVACGGTVRGIVASSPERAERISREWGTSTWYADLDAVLADSGVDVVHVCTPNASHAEVAEAALRAGKPVVCEKPVATTVVEAERVHAAAEASGQLAAVPFVYRYHPLVREIRSRRQAGEFGPWQLIHGSYLQDWVLCSGTAGWRGDPARGGPSRAFADIGSHWCDLVEWVAGIRFAELTAQLGTAPERAGTEDIAMLLLKTAEGTPASLTVSQVSLGRKNRLWFELDGRMASAVFDQENPDSVWLGDEAGGRLLVRSDEMGAAEQRRLSVLPAGHPQGYGDAFIAFVADAYAVMDGHECVGLPTTKDGLRSARIVAAALDAARTCDWTAIPPDGGV